MKTRLLILLLVFSSVGLFSQQQPDSIQKTKTNLPITLSKNSVGVDGSILFVFAAGTLGTSINYERLISKNDSFTKFYYLKTGIGYYFIGGGGDSGNFGVQVPVSLMYLSGKKNNFFEADLGCRAIIYEKSEITAYPIINVGYRYQRRGNRVYFKALVGTDGLTLGVGYAF